MKWIDGSEYKGDWKRGIQHGYGKMIFPTGEIKEGQFEMNIFIGKKLENIQPRTPKKSESSKYIMSGQYKVGKSFKQIDQMSPEL